jgi:probable HAF family extracellular repeat protein
LLKIILLAIFTSVLITGCAGTGSLVTNATNMSSKVAAIGGLPKSVHIKGISDDGSVVVGQFRNNQAPYNWQIFRYTRSSGIENLGTMGGKDIANICISADGLVIAGTFYIKNDGSHIFRYTHLNEFQDFGTMGQKSISVNGVSADGSVIVGSFRYSLTPENASRYHAFRYSQSTGFEDLGSFGAESAFAQGVSANGSLIVGNFHVADGSDHAFIYSRVDGVQDIGAIGGVAAFATGISDNGSVIVGKYFGAFNFHLFSYYNHVFIYTKTGGVKKLGALNGKSAETHSISPDGATFNGSYIDSDGESHVYSAKIVLPVNEEKE